ncbi:MAG: RNA-binding protein [Victivallaceae bacterium]|jgi:RNA recognition motif-containing protein|nr:RNA-binding protein [Victivallaceae bacterium]
MKLIILNLARSTTKKQLKNLFEEYGSVESCDLVLDKSTGKSKGFGFVEMPKPEEAELAIKNLNNKNVANKKIRVKEAEDKR